MNILAGNAETCSAVKAPIASASKLLKWSASSSPNISAERCSIWCSENPDITSGSIAANIEESSADKASGCKFDTS